MRTLNGFKLMRRVRTLYRKRTRHFARIRSWGHRLKSALRSGRSFLQDSVSGSSRRYVSIGATAEEEKPKQTVPKGHLAVYVGGDLKRVLVPVMYFNHPLFGELLREAEKEYGFYHPGGITIPCRISEFERVQTCIAAVHGGQHFTGSRCLL